MYLKEALGRFDPAEIEKHRVLADDELSVLLKSITDYRSARSRGIRDADNMPFLLITNGVAGDSEQFSQELQMQYDSGPLSAILGINYFDEDSFERVTVLLPSPPPRAMGSILNSGPRSCDLQL